MTLPEVDQALVAQRTGFGRGVAGVASGLARVAENGQSVKVVTTVFRVAVQGPGETGGVPRPAVYSGICGDGEQSGPLGIEPRPCRSRIAHRRDGPRIRSDI